MKKRGKYMSYSMKFILLSLIAFFFMLSIESNAYIKESEKDKKEQIQRKVTAAFDLQENSVSNLEFFTTNYGILFLDVARSVGGAYWPRGSLNQYIFGSGIWFAAKKWIWTDTTNGITGEQDRYLKLNKLVDITYNPNSGSSWMVPGRIYDKDGNETLELDESDITSYRTYFSTDFKSNNGEALNPDDGANWPIWDASSNPEDTLKFSRYFGKYIDDAELRNTETYSRGPAFISGEDIFCTFKDTDLNYLEGGKEYREGLGYPLRLQYEQYIYSWGFGDYKDFIFLRYDIINMSEDTLWECYLAPIEDVDIALATNTRQGADNDFAMFYNFDEGDADLNLAVQWTNYNRGEGGQGFGYLGFDFLESPAILLCEGKIDTLVNDVESVYCWMCIKDSVIQIEYEDPNNPGSMLKKDTTVCVEKLYYPEEYKGFPRKDKKFYKNEYQLGLRTFRRWPIAEDRKEDDERYEFLATPMIEEGKGEMGDYRFLMSTGPFNIMPGDTVRTVVGIILANTAVYPDADGSKADLAELVKKDRFAQTVYDNNFQAPQPPDRANLYWSPISNGVRLNWDDLSEMSLDKYEKGLDFLGYRLYRARRPDLDTFNIVQTPGNIKYAAGTGPFGWKEVASWSMPTPFYKSVRRSGKDQNNLSNPFIDSMRIVGPNYIKNDTTGQWEVDVTAIKVMRIGRGVRLLAPNLFVRNWMRTIASQQGRTWTTGRLNSVIYDIDSSVATDPWGKFYRSYISQNNLYYNPYNPDESKNREYVLDSIFIGTIELNSALLKYNPLLWKRVTMNFSIADTANFPDTMDVDGIFYLKDTYRKILIDGTETWVMDKLIPYPVDEAMRDSVHVRKALDSIYHYIQQGLIKKINFPNFLDKQIVRTECIKPYMESITNNRTFVDIGDDNKDGFVQTDLNIEKTEKLINNVPYFYKILAWDTGDLSQPTPEKLNSGFVGLINVVESFPRSERAFSPAKIKTISIDSNKVGGLFNFELYSVDSERLKGLFSGHTLELEFNPSWNGYSAAFQKDGRDIAYDYGLYMSNMTLRDLSDNNRILYSGTTFLEAIPGFMRDPNMFTENTQSWVRDDQPVLDEVTGNMNNLPLTYNDSIITRTGFIWTGDFTDQGFSYSYGVREPARGTLGFQFNYTVQQHGGVLRPDSSSVYPPDSIYAAKEGYQSPIIQGDATTPITFMSDISSPIFGNSSNSVYRTQPSGFRSQERRLNTIDGLSIPVMFLVDYGFSQFGSFNNGPADYLITFKQGGKDTLRLQSSKMDVTKDFICDYLLMDVKNEISYSRPDLKGGTVKIDFPGPVEHMAIETTREYKFPYLPNLGINSNDFIGKYNLTSYGWIDPYKAKKLQRTRTYAVPEDLLDDFNSPASPIVDKRIAIGEPGRYYRSGVSTDGQDSLFFTNVFLASGCNFYFDYSRTGRSSPSSAEVSLRKELRGHYYGGTEDFEAGDQVMLKVRGGALGFPMPGAKVRFYIDSVFLDVEDVTDNIMDEIGVVPNPYYITHQIQQSPYDAKIFFTKLPKRCTIEIYTVTGDLVRSIEHNEYISPEIDKVGIEIWNLLSKNKQRVQSQTFIAYIKTPMGAETIKKFSVVVGGFRLVPEDN